MSSLLGLTFSLLRSITMLRLHRSLVVYRSPCRPLPFSCSVQFHDRNVGFSCDIRLKYAAICFQCLERSTRCVGYVTSERLDRIVTNGCNIERNCVYFLRLFICTFSSNSTFDIIIASRERRERKNDIRDANVEILARLDYAITRFFLLEAAVDPH